MWLALLRQRKSTSMERIRFKNLGGYSLIELMVAACLGLFVISAIHGISIKTLWILQEIKASGEVLENGQYLSGLLSREIGLAGFYGDFDYAYSAYMPSPMPSPDMCQFMSKQKVTQAMPYPLIGIDNISSGYQLCGGETLLSGTDVILLRRSSVIKQSPRYKLTAEQIYIQGSWAGVTPVVDRGDNAAAFNLLQSGERAPVRAWQQTIYYVSKDNVFKRRRYLKGKYLRSEPLVNDIQDFQVEYAVSSSVGVSPCSLDYLSAPLTDSQWQRVIAVRFFILARSSWQGVSQQGKLFDYAGKIFAVKSDGYYQLFSVLAPIMNKLPNRVIFDVKK